MLLSFSFSGFKSFKDKACLDLRPSMVRDLKFSLLKEEYKSKEIKALPCAVIYGPNSAGKTNVLKALNFFKCLVTSRSLDNLKDAFLSTNIHLEKPIISFSIEFINDSVLFEYSTSVSIRSFFNYTQKDGNRIISESLHVNNKLIFERSDKNVSVYENDLPEYINFSSKDFNVNSIANQILQDNILFINSGFKEFVSISLYNRFIEWFETKFEIFDNPSIVSYQVNEEANEEKLKSLNIFSTNLLQAVTDTKHSVRYNKMNGKDGYVPYSEIREKNRGYEIPSAFIESRGSNRLLNLMPIIAHTIEIGGVLAIDEVDTSIHPAIFSNVLAIFHNPEINKNNAQIIITTHNPLYLQKTILRRDEIYFVENESGEGSELYSLSDFKTSGPDSVRNTTDYISNYFMNKFGGIKYVDLSDAVKNYIKHGNK